MVAQHQSPSDAEELLYIIMNNKVVFFSDGCFGMWHFNFLCAIKMEPFKL